MTRIAFFNNKGGVGRTTLAYHLAHMMVDQGLRLVMLDLDPQSNLTSMCMPEERLEDEFWLESAEHTKTILGCIRPILRGVGDIDEPHVEEMREGLAIVPGDPGLWTFEDKLSDAWPRAAAGESSAFRALSAFHRAARIAETRHAADVVLIDVGPNLGALNRAALLATDFIVTPLTPDLFSMQGLRNLGPTLLDWRRGWQDRLARNLEPDLDLPRDPMQPLGYVVMQSGMRLAHPVQAYERWLERIPGEYQRSLLRDDSKPPSIAQDPWCLGIMRNYHSLAPLARDAQKPIFHLKPADGAIGARMDAVLRCRQDFARLAELLLRRAHEMRGRAR
jgi:cellulose biosynthesis protein BcsQ